ncbi:AAA family ATPase [Pelagibacterium flavum]|uniref:AAA family ATPase n=1 Tax=Pelagibacterium flavum TaxID=2984530 RepID=A0ABY6IMF7_9HYPH|nr:AAA family ATPase [Pelagibacterium sp. YIM 151497]UYQ70662.1 AAA family ATPase [Pelagibacterium sp. YIM 151497]
MTTVLEPILATSKLRAHIEMLHNLADGIDGLLVASTYYTDNDKGTITHHPIGDVDGMVEAIEAHQGTPGANSYIGLQVMRRNLGRGKRGTEADIIAVLGLVADMDADTGNSAGEYPLPPNYVVESSEGNFQAFWLFDKPIAPTVAKGIAAGLKAATGSDHCTADVAHVWRVPGTLNHPSATKLARGRSPDPQPVTVAQEWDGTFTDPTALALAVAGRGAAASDAKAVELGELPSVEGIEVSPRAMEKMACNLEPKEDRSGHAYKVVEQLQFDGHTPEEAAAIFLTSTGNWVERYEGDANRMQADFARSWGKVERQRDDERAKAEKFTKGMAKPANDNEPVKMQPAKPKGYPGIVSSGAFTSGFTPPDYQIDGIAQKGFIYSVTAASGTGKTAVLLLVSALTALGESLGEREVRKGRVVYFAGENPDDVKMRWIAAAHHLPFDPDEIDVHFVEGTFHIPEMFERIRQDFERLGGVDLVVIDTSAAYFNGQDENSNTELGKHARELRTLTTLEGRPCVMVACHPTKNATTENLLPRGGGAFIAEMDGNLVCIKSDSGVRLHWQGKHRGPDFEPVEFELEKVTAPRLKDTRGRDVPTVMAKVLGAAQVRAKAATARKDEDDVLIEIDADGGQSLASMAEALGWTKEGNPHKDRVRRATDKLRRDKLVEFKGRKWKVTPAGHEALVDLRTRRHHERQAGVFAAKMAVRAA